MKISEEKLRVFGTFVTGPHSQWHVKCREFAHFHVTKNVKFCPYTRVYSCVWNVGIVQLIPNWTRDGSECAVSRYCRFTPGMSHDSSGSSECAAPTSHA